MEKRGGRDPREQIEHSKTDSVFAGSAADNVREDAPGDDAPRAGDDAPGLEDADAHERRELLRLSLVTGIGPRLQRLLLANFGCVERILGASEAELMRVAGIGSGLAAAIRDRRFAVEAREQWESCRRMGVRLMIERDREFPERLSEIPDPPLLLYVRGQLQAADGLAVAVVGSRRASAYGRLQSQRLAGSLARAGITVVSGLARGIDGVAHRAALEAGGRTVAVLASGVWDVYPAEHRDLASAIARRGALISECPLGQQPRAGMFPQRNRLISGMSLGVIIVEATVKSGAMHTARHALEQGREVLAVPGRVDHRNSAGCHALIRDGATLARNIDDVLDALGPLGTPL